MVAVVVGLFGLATGGFLDVLIYRGPIWLGALVGGVLMISGAIECGSALPFGVFPALADVCTLFLGQDVWDWCLRLVRGA